MDGVERVSRKAVLLDRVGSSAESPPFLVYLAWPLLPATAACLRSVGASNARGTFATTCST